MRRHGLQRAEMRVVARFRSVLAAYKVEGGRREPRPDQVPSSHDLAPLPHSPLRKAVAGRLQVGSGSEGTPSLVWKEPSALLAARLARCLGGPGLAG